LFRTRRSLRVLAVLLMAMAAAGCGSLRGAAPSDGLSSFHEVAMPADAPALILMLSGDGGWWGDIDRKAAERLGQAGYAVAGLDTQDWFRTPRTAREIADHLRAAIMAYSQQTGAPPVVLAGYSFGAAALPAAYNALDARTREKVARIVLLGSPPGAWDQVTLPEQMGLLKPDLPLSPELARIPADKLVCVYGEDEAGDTACELPEMAGARIHRLSGGHHFGNDLDAVVAPLLQAAAEAAKG
jgi:type IV secretory pathway VirJ component